MKVTVNSNQTGHFQCVDNKSIVKTGNDYDLDQMYFVQYSSRDIMKKNEQHKNYFF